MNPEKVVLCYTLAGDMNRLLVPAPQSPSEADGLWKHTCFEAFFAVMGEAEYHEFNFSPSGQWTAYAFSEYRERSGWEASRTPEIRIIHSTQDSLQLEAVIATADLPQHSLEKPLQLALTAVIETNDGRCSYWALNHPSDSPDFHHRTGFACILTGQKRGLIFPDGY